MITSPTAIKNEILELIEVQIKIFGQHAPLTSSELKDCRRRAERIKLLGQELDRCGTAAILDERLAKAS